MQSNLRFRHVFGDVNKKKYENIERTVAQQEACGLKGNSQCFGVSTKSGGGGILTILPNNGYRKIEPDLPRITGHQGAVVDFDFYPFQDGFVATGSEDTHVRLFQFPADGVLTENIVEPVADLSGHGKKVSIVQWNKTSSWLLASGSFDHTVKVWNVQNSSQVLNYDLSEGVTSLDWNQKGSLIGTTTKDKKLTILDPRTNQVALQTECHEGTKSTKFIWLGETGLGLTTGFAQSQERQFKVWDLRNTNSALETVKVDNTSSILFPFYDEDVGMLYLAGKGDGNIRYYEFQDGKFVYLNQFQSTSSGALYGFYPKRCVDVQACELQRAIKLSDKNVEFISFIAPRKNGGEVFQADLYPDCIGETAAQTAEDWFNGKTVDPIRRPMDNSSNIEVKRSVSVHTGFNKAKSQVEQLQEEIERLKLEIQQKDARIKELEAQQ